MQSTVAARSWRSRNPGSKNAKDRCIGSCAAAAMKRPLSSGTLTTGGFLQTSGGTTVTGGTFTSSIGGELAAGTFDVKGGTAEMNGLGRKEFAALYGRIGFDLDAQTRTIVFHDPQSSLNSSRSFDVLSQNDAGAEDGGVTEVRLKIIDDPGPDMILRYGEGGRVVMFAGEQLVAVFARRK